MDSYATDNDELYRDLGAANSVNETIAEASALDNLFKHRTDSGNSEWFAYNHGNDAKFVPEWGRWIFWNGRRWVADDDGEAIRRMKASCRLMIERANVLAHEDRTALIKHALASESAKRISAALELARAELPLHAGALDADPWFLGCDNGTVDLRNGVLAPARREDFITKTTGVGYDPDADCATWLKFLQRSMNGDDNLIDFIQRAIGYTLTGLTHEHCFYMLHGRGRNGKSVMIETWRHALGEYAGGVSMDTFMAKSGDSGPRNDLAGLLGLRFVAAVEGDEGKRLSEAMIKAITGGDTITCRFLHREFFSYTPSFKIVFATNHKPRIRGTDLGMWSRVRLVPFEVVIPANERDPLLLEKLKAEIPGILAWAVRGCLEWQRVGLREPEAVRVATQEYRRTEDVVGSFLADEYVFDASSEVAAGQIYEKYKTWSVANGEHPMSSSSFAARLSDKGLTRRKGAKGVRLWVGLRPAA